MQLIYIHVPKTGGQTMIPILQRHFSDSRSFMAYESPRLTLKEKLKQYRDLDSDQKTSFELLCGHFPFGFHEYLPSGSPFAYLTVLRDPVKRVISHYNYVKNHREHYLQKVPGLLDCISNYVKNTNNFEMNNGQLRLLTNCEALPYEDCNRDLLEEGIRNIDKHFKVVGFTEYFLESVLLMKERLNFSDVRYASRNVSKRKKPPITNQELKTIQEFNQYDIELYNYCLDKFKQQLQLIDQLEEKKQTLKKLNVKYSKSYYRQKNIKKLISKAFPFLKK